MASKETFAYSTTDFQAVKRPYSAAKQVAYREGIVAWTESPGLAGMSVGAVTINRKSGVAWSTSWL